MKRDEALTECAMSVKPELWGYSRKMDYREHSFGWNEYMQRRAELINKPDDAEAPEWAKWRAQDGLGEWWWYQHEPYIEGDIWLEPSPRGIVYEGSVGKIPAGHDWTQTLREVKRDMSKNEPQYDPRAVAFKRQLNPAASSLTNSQARQLAEEFKACSDGAPCGQDDHCDDCPNATHNQDARRLDEQLRDAINPSHYRQGGIECINALAAATVGKTGIEAVCVANVIKYLWRYEEKNGVEDVQKALWYLKRLESELND